MKTIPSSVRRNRRASRLLRVVIAALFVAQFGLLPVASTSAAADGSISIRVWDCPDGTAATDAAGLAAACTTPASNLTFVLTFPNSDVPLTRKTDYPKPGSGEVKWNAPFPDVVTIKLDNPPADVTSVVFCDQGQGMQPVLLADGATLKENFAVPPTGLDCQWYFLPGGAPPAPTNTAIPPTNTPAPTDTPVPLPTVAPTQTPAPPTNTPAPTETPTVLSQPSAPPTEQATEAPATPEETTPAPTPNFIEGPIRIRALPMLTGANYSQAAAINDDRVIVGASGLVDSNGKQWQSAVRWSDGGKTAEELPAPAGGIINDARDINNNGQIVGSAITADNKFFAVLWDEGDPQSLGFLGSGTESVAYAVNDSGQVVGISTTGPDQTLGKDGTHAFLWDADNGMIDLGTLDGAPTSFATDINANGLVVGTSGGSSVVWGADHQIVDLGVHGYAASVNSDGFATGVFIAEDRYIHAYLLQSQTAGAEQTDLGTLENAYSAVFQMNDGNVVVGKTCDQPNCPAGSTSVAALWQNGKVYDLNTLLSSTNAKRWELLSAFGVNAQGDIVGTGNYTESEESDGNTSGFVMFAGAATSVLPSQEQPTPSPAPKEAEEAPREFENQGDYFLRDRIVPLKRTDLVEVSAYKSFIVYAHQDEANGPYNALYIPVSKRASDGFIRYLPEHLNDTQNPCPAEDPRAALPSPYTLSDGSVYVFAGYENDIPGGLLSSMSPTVFYETGSSLPLKEFFVKVDDGMQRWMRLSADQTTLIDQLGPGLSLGGQPVAYRETLPDATGLNLVRVGCAGPFEVSAEFGQDSRPFSKVYLQIGGKLLVFNATAQNARSSSSVVRAGKAFTSFVLDDQSIDGDQREVPWNADGGRDGELPRFLGSGRFSAD